ncbi:hypothetical protein GLOTRDRAFT_131627 [Gloeophyllum trabeum ATCC 11539]|uniref:F-box domain-containing protein n=1 Tax=Gloeophyllum trabeum (strain ATCC 11539 / FP-39264 / Madison 617) TaxID=670483 RepID=S7Q0R6_GLOTA|nr:uncharacterized protein GLOTRDRAFT_131627 [Gloeophyllum trabeum ATCC 11539]EPQ53358.1 hypothetical protein GLOTRDRAFT_131627 [Gloeophyllum trabeum ATCC 11539]
MPPPLTTGNTDAPLLTLPAPLFEAILLALASARPPPQSQSPSDSSEPAEDTLLLARTFAPLSLTCRHLCRALARADVWRVICLRAWDPPATPSAPADVDWAGEFRARARAAAYFLSPAPHACADPGVLQALLAMLHEGKREGESKNVKWVRGMLARGWPAEVAWRLVGWGRTGSAGAEEANGDARSEGRRGKKWAEVSDPAFDTSVAGGVFWRVVAYTGAGLLAARAPPAVRRVDLLAEPDSDGEEDMDLAGDADGERKRARRVARVRVYDFGYRRWGPFLLVDEGEQGGDADADQAPPARMLRPHWACLAAVRVVIEANLTDYGMQAELGRFRDLAGLSGCGAGAGRDDSDVREEGWDWAGVEGAWRRCMCWMDYRKVAQNNVRSPARRYRYHSHPMEAARVAPLQLRVAHYTANPEFPGWPDIYVEGEDEMMGGVCGVVGMIGRNWAEAEVRWSLRGQDGVAVEGVQTGGIGSAMGVLGLWTKGDRVQSGPIGPSWMWKLWQAHFYERRTGHYPAWDIRLDQGCACNL